MLKQINKELILKLISIIAAIAYLVVNFIICLNSYIQKPTYEFTSAWYIVSGLIFAFLFYLFLRQKISRWLWLLPLFSLALAIFSVPTTSYDTFRYLFDGKMIVSYHASPYEVLPLDLPADQYSSYFYHVWWTKIYSPYGPLWQLLMAVINFISLDKLWLGLAWLKIFNLACYLWSAYLIYKLSGKKQLAYLFLLCPVLLFNNLATPHADIAIVALLLCAWYVRKKEILGAWLGSLAGLIKVYGWFLLPFWCGKKKIIRKFIYFIVSGGISLLLLKLILGFKLWPMTVAAFIGGSGGGLGKSHLLIYDFFPWLSSEQGVIISLIIFLLLYLAIYVFFWKGKISDIGAGALASLLVPLLLLCLTYPWHFIIPLGFLFLWQKKMAWLLIIFISFYSFLAPLNLTLAILCFVILIILIKLFSEIYKNLLFIKNTGQNRQNI